MVGLIRVWRVVWIDTNLAMKPTLILAAGVPRSGSTWLFNAIRCLLEESLVDLHAAWISDWNPQHPAPNHLVKVHSPEDAGFDADFVFTTNRRTEDCLASLVRMGWLRNDPAEVNVVWRTHEKLQSYWKSRSSLEISYDDIMNEPCGALHQIAEKLCINIVPSRLMRIADELVHMEEPMGGKYDPKTLLHPGHRRHTSSAGPSPEEILSMVRK
jgi:hypothetical protein